MANSIVLNNITKTYGRQVVLDNVSFALPEGNLIALVGHNGAGKSTLIKLILGLIRPNAGAVEVLGQDPASAQARKDRTGVGYLPENVAFNGAMTAREVLAFFSKLKREPVEKSLELLDLVGLADVPDNKIRTFSKGMRQRLGLAQALIGHPRLLLLDEPTSGLDPAAQAHFYELINMLKTRGTSILISSHALTELEARADMVAMMNSGHLVACASLAELRQQADLPTRIHLQVREGQAETIAAGFGPRFKPHHVNGSRIELDIGAGAKIALLEQITALGDDALDVDIQPPSLDRLYAAFCQREETGNSNPRSQTGARP